MKDFQFQNYIHGLFYGGVSKGDLMKLAFGENYTNVDSALPSGWVNEVKTQIPDFNTSYWVMDYRNGHGTPVHLLEAIRIRFQSMESDEIVNLLQSLKNSLKHY